MTRKARHASRWPLRLVAWRERLTTNLWLIPTMCVIGAVLLSVGTTFVDGLMPQDKQAFYLLQGQAESARKLLSTIISSMITFTGVVFSITILVLQLASGQYSSRVLRTFLQDRKNKTALGMFVGTFVYAMLILTKVRAETQSHAEFVPAFGMWIAFVLVLGSVWVFILYIDRMAQSIRVVTVVRKVAEETRESIDRMFPEQVWREPEGAVQGPSGPPDRVLCKAGPAGVVIHVREELLMRQACEADLVIALLPHVGDFVPSGAPLLALWGSVSVDEDLLQRAAVVGQERTPYQDPGFGFRQLVDIAERAVSPGINDPTTAVQVLDQLHDLLRLLTRRPFPWEQRVDEEGRLRLILPRPDFDSFVRLALDEIREYGQGSIQVARRLRALLVDCLKIAPRSRRPVLLEQLELLDASVRRA